LSDRLKVVFQVDFFQSLRGVQGLRERRRRRRDGGCDKVIARQKNDKGLSLKTKMLSLTILVSFWFCSQSLQSVSKRGNRREDG